VISRSASNLRQNKISGIALATVGRNLGERQTADYTERLAPTCFVARSLDLRGINIGLVILVIGLVPKAFTDRINARSIIQKVHSAPSRGLKIANGSIDQKIYLGVIKFDTPDDSP
jgi:hypothetical protein